MISSIKPLSEDQKRILQPSIPGQRFLLKSHPEDPKEADGDDHERTSSSGLIRKVTEDEGSDQSYPSRYGRKSVGLQFYEWPYERNVFGKYMMSRSFRKIQTCFRN
jgi:hypothetical protein